jgi:hypothetical protein
MYTNVLIPPLNIQKKILFIEKSKQKKIPTRISSGSISRIFNSPNSISPFDCNFATRADGSTPSANERNRSRLGYSSLNGRNIKHNYGKKTHANKN